jgi:hypothetical protein
MSRLLLGLAALTLLSSCGIKNSLERPDPLWNAQNAVAHECARERSYNTEHPAHPRPLDSRCGASPSGTQDTNPPPPQSPTAPR